MHLRYALAGAPAIVLLSSAIAVAWGSGPPAARRDVLKSKIDVGSARTELMVASPVGTPVEVAFRRLQEQGLSCAISEPPLANLTWRVVECSTVASMGAKLRIDVAGRNGVVADIGVEDGACAIRADAADPAPGPLDCDISSKRLLALEAEKRAKEGSFLADLLGSHASKSAPHR